MITVSEKEYKCAYKEVYMIIESSDDEIRNKIPEDKIEFYKSHMDDGHEFELDFDKDLSEQNLLYPTRCILANLFRDYIATEDDRAEIIKQEQEELKEIENKKREKYNPNDVFKNNPKSKKEKTKIQAEEIKTRTDMIIQNENISWFEKFKNKIIELINGIFKK